MQTNRRLNAIFTLGICAGIAVENLHIRFVYNVSVSLGGNHLESTAYSSQLLPKCLRVTFARETWVHPQPRRGTPENNRAYFSPSDCYPNFLQKHRVASV